MKIAIALLVSFVLTYLPSYPADYSPEVSMKFDTPYFLDNFGKFPADTLLLVGVLANKDITKDIKLSNTESIVAKTKTTFTAFMKPASVLELSRNASVLNINFTIKNVVAGDHNPNYTYIPQKFNFKGPIQRGIRTGGMEEYLKDPELNKFDGKGVLIGVIEAGLIDFRHSDFLNADGSTRFLAIWDQQDDSSITNSAFRYGRVWRADELNAIIQGKSQALTDFGESCCHVTNSASVAAGNGFATGNYCGVAPGANLVQVKYSSCSALHLINACRYIFNLADSLGMPCVITISQITFANAYDGSDIASVAVSEMVKEKPGRIVFSSAGNNGTLKFHNRYVNKDNNPDGKFCWMVAPWGLSKYSSFYLKINKNDVKKAEFSLDLDTMKDGDNDYKPNWIKLENCLKDPMKTYKATWNDSTELEYIIKPSHLSDSTLIVYVGVRSYKNAPSEYALLNRFSIRGDMTCDFWGSLYWQIILEEDMEGKTPPTNYITPDNKYLVQPIACGKDIMAVGTYYNQIEFVGEGGAALKSSDENDPNSKTGDPWFSTQQGGDLSGFWKPDFLSPGMGVGAAFPLDLDKKESGEPVLEDGLHMIYSGTSAASPVAAGMGALFLQKNPNATFEDFRTAVRETADVDETTGPVPNAKCGYGKINLYKLMKWEKRRGE
ncbi:MAG: S8 family serine peptidase [Chloroflexota bacterium]